MDKMHLESDSDTDNSSTDSLPDPLQDIHPEILAQLRHLDLSACIFFREKNFVGGGGYGDIFRGRCNIPDRGKVKVAIKRLRFYLKEDIKLLFEKEIYVWSKLKHANILSLLGYAFANEYRYPLLVSEWMDRGSAWVYVRTHLQCDVIQLVTGIARGLAYLHENGVVHSDMKSDNVLVSNSGDALICDFGCARMASATRSIANMSTSIRGTLRYLAYELLVIIDSSLGHTKETDVWAFGMTTLELLSRQRPFPDLLDGQVITAITKLELPSLPSRSDYWASRGSDTYQSLWSICLGCWNPNPESRIDMMTILDTLTTLQTIEAEQHIKGSTSEEPRNAVKLDRPKVGHRESYKLGMDEKPLLKYANASSSPIPLPSKSDQQQINPSATSIGSFLDGIDLESLPPHARKIDNSWLATFNPGFRRMLDVDHMYSMPHNSSVSCVRFSAAGKYIAIGCKQDARIYDSRAPRSTCIILYDEGGISLDDQTPRSICFSPDGKLIASARGKTIKIWDLTSRTIKRIFHGHQRNISSLEFSSKGSFIVSGSDDCTVRVWDMENGMKRVLQTKEPPGVYPSITSVSISPDEQLIAAGSVDSIVRIWEVQSGNLIERLRGHNDAVNAISFMPDGKGLVTGGCDKTVRQWDISSLVNGSARRLPLPPPLKPSGTVFKSSLADPGAANRPKRKLPAPPESVSEASATPSRASMKGGTIAAFAREGGERGSTAILTYTGHKDSVLGVAASDDGRWIVSGSKDNEVHFFSQSVKQVCVVLKGENSVVSLDFSLADNIFATATSDMQTQIWSCVDLL